MLNKSIEIKKSIDELTWWRDFKEKQQQEHNQIQRDIFRETMKESRKKEILKNRTKRKFETFWDIYKTSRNFD